MENKELCNCDDPGELLHQPDIHLIEETHRFESSEYLYLHIMSITEGQTNTTIHNYLYRYFRDVVPRFQFLTELSAARGIGDTDRPHVLAYERNKFLHARLLSCCRKSLWRTLKKQVVTWLFSWRPRHHGGAHLGAHFWDVPSCC